MILGILLAAGASRRMGSDKLELPWRGSTVLATTLARWCHVDELDEILVVRRRESPELRQSGVRTLVNEEPDEGMGSSLRLAARSLSRDTKAVVVGLADMPEVASSTISDLVNEWRAHGANGLVAPVYKGRRGHPVVFGANYIPALGALTGDAGARSILRDRDDALHLVEVDDAGVLLDIDEPSDLEGQP